MYEGLPIKLQLRARRGFSLIELVVGLAVIAILAAFVYPVVIQQIEKWEAMRVARDLSNLRVAIEQFHLETQNHPRQLTHLANPIQATEGPLASRSAPTLKYAPREISSWDGPYVDRDLARAMTDLEGIQTGFDGRITTAVLCMNPNTAVVAACGPGMYVALFVSGLRAYQFMEIDRLIDASVEELDYGQAKVTGKLVAGGMIGIDGDLTPVWTYYLAMPYLHR